MKITNISEETLKYTAPTALALGFFDGLHQGHCELVRKTIEYAKAKDLKSVVFTFDKSPKQVLGQEFLGYITTQEEKISILSEMGIDEICYIPFTSEFANLSKEEFVREYLINKLKGQAVFVGFNFSFGAKKSGNTEFLKQELEKLGKECFVIKPVAVKNQGTVSSSLIRTAIKDGDIPKANLLIGREFSFTGKVIHGDHRATGMGFPTANILLENSEKCLPPNGVYACYGDIAEGTFPAIVNIGYRPTFNKNTYLLEAHLCGFKGNLYDKEVRVRFLKAIRPEIKFPSMGALISQIEKDRQTLFEVIEKTEQN